VNVEEPMSKDKPTTQWHPLFADLLRPLLQNYFDVRTNVAVGDAPRQADIVLCRTGNEPTPFHGLWRHLTTWNIFEFKGPSVSARVRDLDLLIELGLGIDRRMNKEQQRQRQALLGPAHVSFWYIVKSLGQRFLRDARQRLGQIQEIDAGLWRSQVLQRLVFLVSSDTIAIEPESVPLHLLIKRAPTEEHALARLIVEQPNYWEWYASVLSTFHAEIWAEVRQMARTKGKELQIDFSALINDKDIGMKKLVEALGVDQVLEAVGLEKIIKEKGVDWLIAKLPPAQRKILKERL
jgi:hypothetical protein